MQSLLSLLQDSSLAALLDGSRYISMAVQSLHVLGFTFLLALVVVFNLRVQRIALRSISVADFTRSTGKLYYAGLAAAVVGGVLLFLPRSIAYGGNRALLYKLVLLVIAIVLQYLLRQKALSLGDSEASAPLRITAAATLVLWFVVGAAGRAIGFV